MTGNQQVAVVNGRMAWVQMLGGILLLILGLDISRKDWILLGLFLIVCALVLWRSSRSLRRTETETPPAVRLRPGARLEGGLARIAILAIVSVVAFVLVETVARVALPEGVDRTPFDRRFPVGIVRRPRPYVMFGGQPNGHLSDDAVGESLNALGYRGPAPDRQRADGELRVFVLGGSTVFNGDPPIPRLLEQALHQAGRRDVRVFNFGVVSSVSSMELVRVVTEIGMFQPDIILMYNGGNDILLPYTYDPRPGYPFNFAVYEGNPLLEPDVADYPTFALTTYGSLVFRLLARGLYTRTFVQLDELREEAGHGTGEWRDTIAEIYVRNVEMTHRMSAALGARFVCFYQPLLAGKPIRTEQEQQMAEAEYIDHCVAVHQRILALAATLPDDLRRSFVDLSGIYAETPEAVFTDIIHTRQEAKGRVVNAMLEHLGPLLAHTADESEQQEIERSR